MDILKNKNVVCLGGGVGTSNLLRGIKHFGANLTVITSMADDGGSAGRLRKAYSIMPPGDIVNSLSALIADENAELAQLMVHRFPGSSSENKILDGHKLGNLMMLAEIQRTGDFYKAIDMMKRMFDVTAELLPATDERVHLSAITHDGRRVHSETTLDLAKYSEPYGIEKVYISPSKPLVNPRVAKSLLEADYIISGPGDLYTNQLPVLIVPEIKSAILESTAQKLFIMNVANKPFETKGFTLKNFVQAMTEHLGAFPFHCILANNNMQTPIPSKYHYKYIQVDPELHGQEEPFRVIETDLIREEFPLYHNPTKLASAILKLYNK